MVNKKFSILLAEDSESIVDLLKDFLSASYPNSIIHATNQVKEIPKLMRKNNIDLIIADRMLLDGNAWEELSKQNYDSFKKIFMSGTPEINAPKNIPFFQKPFCVILLGEKIDEILFSKKSIGSDLQ